MTKTANDYEDSIQQAAQKLLDDLNSSTPTISSDVVWAYQDENVQRAIVRRLMTGGRVATVKSVLPDIVTRYRRVYIDFSTPSLAADKTGDGILVQINDSNRVVEIIDPFSFPAERRRVLEEHEGTFLTGYSTPLARSGRGDSALNARYERFVREEGVDVAFMRFRESIGGGGGVFGGGGEIFWDFASGTCVITTYRIPVYTGGADPFPGTEGTDAEEQEDDTPNF